MKKQKEAWAIFSFFLPKMSKRSTSALLPITHKYTIKLNNMEIVKLRIKGTLVNISMAKLDRATKTKKVNKYRNVLERIIKN